MLQALFDWWWNIRLPASHRRRIRRSHTLLAELRVQLLTGDAVQIKRVFGYLRTIDSTVFEELTLTALADAGYRIKRNRRYTGDGGSDGWVWLDRKWCPVQCKRYSSAINPAHVRDFAVLLEKLGVGEGVFVHTGRTGDKSWQSVASSARKIHMVSGRNLCEMIAGGPIEAARIQSSE